ncbi:MAG: phytanoyl-CoA dioxygenase family protein [Gammaproteobacteria bacterium]|nr:phytanoyl-CoA dioxygenase family protein [Gammaproteobacteria bacterium]
MLSTMELHERNRDFQWQDPSGPYEFISEAQAEAFCRDGAFCLEKAFDAEEIAAVVAAIDPIEAEAEAFLSAQEDGTYGIARAGEISFSPHLVARDEVLARFARHEVLLALLRDLIGNDVRLYWDQLVYKKGNTADEFPWHQDNGYTFVEPQQYLTCWIALTAASVDNGCPWIVPGVHRSGTLHHRWTPLGFQCLENPAGAVPLPLEVGSIAVFSSLTPHRTGPNTTPDTRKAYILQYAADGAVFHPHNKPPVTADNADWQFEVLRDGIPVAVNRPSQSAES